jgi:hypothetical protein
MVIAVERDYSVTSVQESLSSYPTVDSKINFLTGIYNKDHEIMSSNIRAYVEGELGDLYKMKSRETDAQSVDDSYSGKSPSVDKVLGAMNKGARTRASRARSNEAKKSLANIVQGVLENQKNGAGVLSIIFLCLSFVMFSPIITGRVVDVVSLDLINYFGLIFFFLTILFAVFFLRCKKH